MLARLRGNLDFFPSPVEEQPGLVIRDPFHYSDATLIVPPALVACLEFFDGQQSDLELRAFLVRLTGDVQAGEIATHLSDALSGADFLEAESFASRTEAAQPEFAASNVREPSHAGSRYPSQAGELTETLPG